MVSRARLMDILSSADVGIVAQKASPYSHLVHTNKMVDYWIFGLPVIASRLKAVSATYNDHVIDTSSRKCGPVGRSHPAAAL